MCLEQAVALEIVGGACLAHNYIAVKLSQNEQSIGTLWCSYESSFVVCVHAANCQGTLSSAAARERDQAHKAGHRQRHRSVSSRFRDIDELQNHH